VKGAVLLAVAAAACGNAPRRALAPPPPHPAIAAAPREPMSRASMLADIAWLTADERAGRGSDSPEARATAVWLEAQLRAAGLAVATQDVPGTDRQVNVIATYPGRRPGKALLLVAHYDHLGRGAGGAIYRGADDNSSGVAALLAVARDLGARRDLDREVVFLFTAAEESGLHGSRAYAEAPAVPFAETRAIVNLDMVGRRFFELAVGRDAAIGAVGLADDPGVGAAVRAAAADAGIALVEVSPKLLFVIGEAYRSDDWSLRDRGVPAVFLSTGLHDDYHEPSDTPDKLSPAQLERAARLVRGIASHLDAEL
jgi:Zn-dependent M28 family amino/carboxypeptidase